MFTRSRIASLLLAVGMCLAPGAYATPPDWLAVDVTPLDISGVKLGMGYEQVLATVAERFQLSPAQVQQLRASTLRTYSRVTKQQQPASIRLKKDNTSLEVTFSVRLPVDPGDPVGVSRIHYGIPNTPDNVAMLKESSLAKYGRPSDNRRKSHLMWCAHYNQIAQCDRGQPNLSLAIGSLVLTDPRMEDAISRHEQGLLTTRPAI